MSDFLELVRAFTRDHLIGHEKDLDQPGNMPTHLHKAFAQQGLSNWWLPASFGGRGLNLETSVDAVAELAYGDAGFSFASFIPILSSSPILLFGTEAQKARYLRPSMAGATMASEKEAGSELLRIATTATRTSGGYSLSGEKFFATNVAQADFCLVYTRAEDNGAYKALIVDRDNPGMRIVQRWPMIGLRASGTYEISLSDCQVSEGALLDGNGLRILEVALNASRLLIAASGIGIARRTRDLCLDYARDKKIKDGSLLRNDVFAAKIGQMQIYIDTMNSVCKEGARDIDSIFQGPEPGQTAFRRGLLRSVIVAKSMCGQLGWDIVSTASEMFGGLGYTEHSLMGKLMRDMRYISIVEAGDDVMRSLMYTRFAART